MPRPDLPMRSRVLPWLWATGAVLLVAGSGLATWQWRRSAALAPATAAGTRPAESTPHLLAGHDYYLHVNLIELTERRPDGKAWDSVDGSGPDIKFSLTWRHNVIWNSPEKPDTLIGSWDFLKVDLRQMIVTGGPTDLEGMVNAPLVHCEKGETVELKVWDNDTVGSDDAGSLVLKLDDLRPGENTLTPPLDKQHAIKRVVLALIDRRTPVPELVNMISNR